jgi:hypothetical protein
MHRLFRQDTELQRAGRFLVYADNTLYLPSLFVFADNGFYPPILENRRGVPAALMFVVVKGLGSGSGQKVPAVAGATQES